MLGLAICVAVKGNVHVYIYTYGMGVCVSNGERYHSAGRESGSRSCYRRTEPTELSGRYLCELSELIIKPRRVKFIEVFYFAAQILKVYAKEVM